MFPTEPPTAPPPPHSATPRLGPSGPSIGERIQRRFRSRPRVIDAVMLVAAALSYAHHIHGAGFVAVLAWWVVWILLWVAWTLWKGSGITAVICLAVLALMVTTRTDLGFALNRSCFEERVAPAIAAHDAGGGNQWQDRDRCGLMQYQVITIRQSPAQGELPVDDWPTLVYFHGAGETYWSLFGHHGIVYSPEVEPQCTSGVFANTHGCTTEPMSDGWYYYSADQNIN